MRPLFNWRENSTGIGVGLIRKGGFPLCLKRFDKQEIVFRRVGD